MKNKYYHDMLKTQNYIIDHSPKAGCTVVKKTWFDQMGDSERALHAYAWIIEHINLLPQTMVNKMEMVNLYKHELASAHITKFGAKVTEADLESDDFVKIKYVRNPYARAVSSFFHVAKTRLIQHFPADMNFREFLRLLPDRLDAPGSGHWNIQNKYPEIIYDEIIKIENIHNETERLNKKYNLNLNSDTTSTHHSLDLKQEEINDAFNMPADVILNLTKDDSKPIPTYDSFYNDEIKQMVDEFYGIDVKTYQYEFPY